MTKEAAIYEAFCEIVPYTNEKITIQIEENVDEYGNYVRVHYNNSISSKIRYISL